MIRKVDIGNVEVGGAQLRAVEDEVELPVRCLAGMGRAFIFISAF